MHRPREGMKFQSATAVRIRPNSAKNTIQPRLSRSAEDEEPARAEAEPLAEIRPLRVGQEARLTLARSAQPARFFLARGVRGVVAHEDVFEVVARHFVSGIEP